VPELSRLFGIVITMYARRHPTLDPPATGRRIAAQPTRNRPRTVATLSASVSASLLAQYTSLSAASAGIGDPGPLRYSLNIHHLEHLGGQTRSHCPVEPTGFNSAEYVTSLDDVDFADADRLLFTFSYVVHQNAVTTADMEEWSSLIKRAVSEVGQDAELIYSTARRPGGAHIYLKQALKEAKILRRQRPIDVQVRRRFPESRSSHGRICWEEQTQLRLQVRLHQAQPRRNGSHWAIARVAGATLALGSGSCF